MEVVRIIITFAVAIAGGLLLSRTHVPGGMLVGAILAVALFNVVTGQAFIYPQTRMLAQVLTGAYIGCTITREDLGRMHNIIPPYLIVMVTFLVLNLAVGFFIWKVTDLDLLTSLFCACPGGMTDTPLIALDMGADASVVAVMQFVRMVFGMGCLPYIILLSDRVIEARATNLDHNTQEGEEEPQHLGSMEGASFRKFLPAFGVAFLAGLLGRWSGIPAGTLSGALLAVIVLKVTVGAPPMPLWLRRLAQVVSGCCIGASVAREQISQLGQMLVPALVLVLGYILVCVGMGYVIARVTHMDLKEAMLCMSPAGASEMALIAADMGINSPNLIVLQISRLVGVVAIFPQVYSLVVWLVG